jgi:hypothetical protein
MEKRTVAGEPLELLQAAFAKLKHKKRSDDMVDLSLKLDPELGEPLLRALLRIERELLDQDVSYGDPHVRTTSQRRADAFVLLAERLTAMLDRP